MITQWRNTTMNITVYLYEAKTSHLPNAMAMHCDEHNHKNDDGESCTTYAVQTNG